MMRIDNIDLKKIAETQDKVEQNSATINKLVEEVITPYCKDLDKYISFIRECLKDGQNPPTDEELDDFVLNLSTYIYWASGACEQLGIRDDISKAVYKEVYHTKRSGLNSGTVADKDSIAELESVQEQITNVVYNRAYKIMKAKVENAQELLSSCKKVLSHRLSEMSLTQVSN
jgi:uncharacterized protein YukE